MIRRRLTYWRRRRCIRRGLPMAAWSPVCISEREPDRLLADGTIEEGRGFTQRAWRCALHDEEGAR